METKKVIEIALWAGEILLCNGGETYRVEETVTKICEAYGLECECLSLSTGIFISAKGPNSDEVASVKRIKQRRVDLYRIELVNSFSRTLVNSQMDYEEAISVLRNINDAPNFSFKVRAFAACMTSFVYTLFFNGTMLDAVISIFISLIVYITLEKISEIGFFQFFEYYLSGLIIGGVSLLTSIFIKDIDKNNVITGAIMILLPGVALTNGIKDILYGDYSSGLAKFLEAMLIITAVGAGIGTALAIGLRWV